jgi:hypothetical protein
MSKRSHPNNIERDLIRKKKAIKKARLRKRGPYRKSASILQKSARK